MSDEQNAELRRRIERQVAELREQAATLWLLVFPVTPSRIN
jgi:hypothetical protein